MKARTIWPLFINLSFGRGWVINPPGPGPGIGEELVDGCGDDVVSSMGPMDDFPGGELGCWPDQERINYSEDWLSTTIFSH